MRLWKRVSLPKRGVRKNSTLPPSARSASKSFWGAFIEPKPSSSTRTSTPAARRSRSTASTSSLARPGSQMKTSTLIVRFAAPRSRRSAGKNSSPLVSSSAVPPERSGAPATPARETRNSVLSTAGMSVTLSAPGLRPNAKKRDSSTPTIATTPVAARKTSHRG